MVEHFVQTQRTDRTGVNRDELSQGTLVDHTMVINAEAMINISRKRLCTQASKETRQLWNMIVEELQKVEPELASVCVPDCIYRGKCFEFKPCGYSESDMFKVRLQQYRDLKGE